LSYPLVTALSPALYQQRSGLVDSLLTYPFWIGVVFAVQLSLLLIVVDLGRLLFYPAYRKLKKDRKRWQRWLRAQAAVTLVLTGAVAAYCGIRVYEDTLGVRVRRVAFPVSELPSELDGLKIAQISDVHVDFRTKGKKLERYVDAVNRESPDIVIFCGDLVS